MRIVAVRSATGDKKTMAMRGDRAHPTAESLT